MGKSAIINPYVLANNVITIKRDSTMGLFTINSSYKMQTIEVTNAAAQLILRQMCTDRTEHLQLQNFVEDICFVRILYSNGMSVTKKVTINKNHQ